MKTQEIQNIVAGFDHDAFGSQAVFRIALDALSHPGRPFKVPTDCALPQHGQASAATLMLGLLDADTSLWLSPSLALSDAAPWLRFHTGSQIVTDPNAAQFLWVALGDELPAFEKMRLGTDTYPDQSATCIIETKELHADIPGWVLSGPGVLNERNLLVEGISKEFAAQWRANHELFPRGIDVLLTTETHIVGLPRTTQLANTGDS